MRRIVADDFLSPFFELYLHGVLRVLGLCPQVEPHQFDKRPDFLCQSASGPFAIEASVVGGESVKEQGKRALLNVVFDAINEVASPDYFFDIVECEVKGVQQPSLRAITSFIARRVESAD